MSIREPKRAPSRIPPTGYGPFWPSLLGRGLLRWRQRTNAGPARADSLTAWLDQKSAEDRHDNARN